MTSAPRHLDAGAGIRLVSGAMQNWSDLATPGPSAAPLVAVWLRERLEDVGSCLVVGAHALPLLTTVAAEVGHLTVLTRSIPDATAIAESLVGAAAGVDVACGSLAALAAENGRYDLVIALDDLSRTVSLEEPGEVLWADAMSRLAGLVAPGGRLLLGVQSDLGLDSLASLRSRWAANADGDWAVLSTFDDSRPRSADGVVAALAGHGLSLQTQGVAATYPVWQAPTVLTRGEGSFSAPLQAILAVVTVRSRSLRAQRADPSRVVRAAGMTGRLGDFASGWLVEGTRRPQGAGEDSPAAQDPGIVEMDSLGRVLNYHPGEGSSVMHSGPGGSHQIQVPHGSVLLHHLIVDAVAQHDLPAVRALLRDHLAWLRGRADLDGRVPAADALAGFDNVLVRADGRGVLALGEASAPADEVMRHAMADLVAGLRASGARLPWPASTGDPTLRSILEAMAGLPVHGGDIDPSLADAPSPAPLEAAFTSAHSPSSDASMTQDVAGLLAVVDRLTEEARANASRAEWYERRLGQREREVQTLTTKLRDVRASVSFRTGRLVLAPAVRLRALSRTARARLSRRRRG